MESFKEMKILKIEQRDKIWKDIKDDDYELKVLELKKGKPKLHLVYNNDITLNLIYECFNCKKEVKTSWSKFHSQQIMKNKCLCQKCSAGTLENRNKISSKTKEAMNNEKVKLNHSIAQKKRFSRQDEKEKSSKRSKEIMSRDGIKEYIGTRVKEEFNKYDTKELCNPLKHMNEEEKITYYENIGKKISDGYDKKTYSKFINSYNKTMKKSKESQWNLINGIRKTIIKKRSNLQQIVYNYISNIINVDVEEEFPINLYEYDLEYKFILIDIAIPDKNIAIEVLGNYYHDAFADYLNGLSKEEIEEKYKDDDFQKNRFKKDLFDFQFYKTNNWKILYLTENQILNGNWINIIDDFLKNS